MLDLKVQDFLNQYNLTDCKEMIKMTILKRHTRRNWVKRNVNPVHIHFKNGKQMVIYVMEQMQTSFLSFGLPN